MKSSKKLALSDLNKVRAPDRWAMTCGVKKERKLRDGSLRRTCRMIDNAIILWEKRRGYR